MDLWRPFVLKSRYIEDRFIISLGLIFYPNEKKRDYVRTFELFFSKQEVCQFLVC